MPRFRLKVTRDCTFTQTAEVDVEADDAEDAADKATLLDQDAGLGWLDDDGSYHFGEDGVYVPDPTSI